MSKDPGRMPGVMVQPDRGEAILISTVRQQPDSKPTNLDRWSERQVLLCLTLADLLVLVLAYLFTISRVEAYTSDLHFPDIPRMLVWCSVLVLIWLPVASKLGLYQRVVVRQRLQSAYVIAKSTLIAGALFHIIPLVGGPVYSRSAALTVVLALVSTMLVWRLAVSRVIPSFPPRDFVIVGLGWAGRTLAEAVAQHPHAGVRILAFVDNDENRIGTSELGLPVLPLEDLPKLLPRPNGGRAGIVLSLPDEAHASFYEQLTSLAQIGIDVSPMPTVYEQVTGRIPVRHLGNFWWAILPKPSTDIVYVGSKRAIDICLALIGLVLLGLLLPVLRLLQVLDSPGPLLFTQARIGRYGKPLTLAKLRTLPSEPSNYADHWERKNANKPSRFGALLRASGIDELPQCWNVLKGEMSIVGPRPYVAEEVADFQRQIPFFHSRSLVKPGLTGWAQVNWGYGLSIEDEVEKLQYDLYYVGHQSIYMDVLIILRTMSLMLQRKRPRNVNELYVSIPVIAKVG